MLILDDLLLAPFRSLVWVFEKIHRAAEEANVDEAQSITHKLSELYMMLETGQITEAEFDTAEKQLLDRLDAINGTGT